VSVRKVSEEMVKEMSQAPVKQVTGDRIPLDVLIHERQLKIAAIHMSRKQ
jgi:hypothetical protein